MAEINVLSKELSELIAAGEVIERPSSIVKELLENAIDSKANSITVEIKNGGVSYIRITDNGCGISEKDVPTAFLRHATSKISSQDDLENIMTLGFRGEALASISAVSKVEVLTKPQGDQYGTHYIIQGSQEMLIEKSGCPDGTTFIVRDIFYNVPARLKFLKKDVTEGNAISSVVDKIALSHPDISFRFIRDNKQELFTPGDNDYYSDIYSVFGKSFSQSLIPVDYTINNISIKGYTVKPLYSRANRSFQNFFINNRYIKSVTCTVSLEEAYKNSIMTGKFPACVLNIEVPPNVVDVNVHPAKIEVKFSDEKMIFDSIYFAVKNALMTEDKPKELEIAPTQNITSNTYENVRTFEPVVDAAKNQIAFNSEKIDYSINKNSVSGNSCFSLAQSEERLKNNNNIEEKQLDEFKYISDSSFIKKEEPLVQEPPQNNSVEYTKNIKIIGEAFANYIIAEVSDELMLIDKHAAHERLLFEKLKSREKSFDCQMFVSPCEVMLSMEEFDAVSENLDILKYMGFDIVPSDGNVVLVNGIPSYLDDILPEDLLPEISQNLINTKHDPNSDAMDDLFHSVACKAAIKANDKTSLEELTSLAYQLFENDKIRYCPHGRPVMIRITKRELEKQFKRIV